MEYPCYQIQAITEGEKIEQFNYIIKKLKSFGYNIRNECLYTPITNLIVINDCGIFGDINNVYPENIKYHNRFLIKDFNEFLLTAAEFKVYEFEQNNIKNNIKNNMENNMENNMKNNKPQTIEPKIGDIVLVKNAGDENYVQRIYLGIYKNKYITVGYNTSNNFKECCNFGGTFWDEMITELKVTKTQIAERFGVPANMLEIVD